MSATLLILLRTGGIKKKIFRRTFPETYTYRGRTYLPQVNGTHPDVDNVKKWYVLFVEGYPFPVAFGVSPDELMTKMRDIEKVLKSENVSKEGMEKIWKELTAIENSYKEYYNKNSDMDKKQMILTAVAEERFTGKLLGLAKTNSGLLLMIAGSAVSFGFLFGFVVGHVF